MEYARAGCASLIALVFLISTVAKMRNFGDFRRSLPALAPPIRPSLAGPLAVVVVIAEAATSVLLMIPPAMSYGFGLGGLLLVAFTAAIAVALRNGRRTPCRCFGASNTPVGPRHLVRNITLLVIAVAGGLAPGSLPTAAGSAVAAVAGLIGAILIASLDDIVDLYARSS